MSRVSVSETVKAAAFYAALTMLFTYPLSVHPGETVFGDNPDTHLFIYTLAWDAHAFLHQPLAMFDANIYYPNRLTLAFSENQIGNAFIAAPILWLTGDPVLAMNGTALFTCMLCGVGAYILARRLGLDARAAILGGLVFAFAPARFARTGQTFLGAVEWIPFALASLHSYLDGGGRRALWLFLAFFTLQALTSGHGTVFLIVAAGSLVAYRLIFGEPLALRQRLRDLGVPGVLLVVPAALVYMQYRRVQIEVGLRRSLEDWAPTPQSFLAAPTHLQQWLLSFAPGLHVNETASAYLFPSFLPVLLAGAALFYDLKDRRSDSGVDPVSRPPRGRSSTALILEILVLAALASALVVFARGPIRWKLGNTVLMSVRDVLRPMILAATALALRVALVRSVPFGWAWRLTQINTCWRQHASDWRRDTTMFYAVMTLIAVWISMGPPIGLWPLIYWLPGFNFIRVPYRFMVLAMLGFAVLAAIGFTRLTSSFTARKQTWLAAAVALLMIGEFAGFPLPVTPYHLDIPPIDRWLATRPTPFVVAEFPVSSVVRTQTAYMLHSMAHWQKTIHGYSGIEAPLHTKLYQELRGFPDDLSLRRLRELDISYMVVHTDRYRPDEWQDVEGRLQQFADQLTLEQVEGSGRVYSLRRFP